MKLTQLHNKKVAFLGLGIENYALVNYLLRHKIKCEITICDRRDKEQLGEKYGKISQKFIKSKVHKVEWKLGKNFNEELDRFDILFRSPGWPIDCPGVQDAIKQKQIESQQPAISNFIYSPMKLFFDLCSTKNIIGVTGTKGKGTTSSLIYQILKTAGKKVFLGGNIGIAPFDFIDKIKSHDWVVLELSSFQLEDLHKSPRIAVITNFYNEHLAPADPNNPNYHKSAKQYWNAKANIYSHQDRNGALILNYKISAKVHSITSKLYTFSFNEKKSNCHYENGEIVFIPIQKSEIRNQKFIISSSLSGNHNLENIAAASLATKLAGASSDEIKTAVKKFKGLEHRIEKVALINGVGYYDDSFATTPESTITALKSFDAPIILIAGGAEKNSNFQYLARQIVKSAKFVVLLDGKATSRLKQEILTAGYPKKMIKLVHSMDEALNVANENSKTGDIILLSTACASFGMFKNYKERGDKFKKAVLRV